MRYQVIELETIETQQGDVILPVGKILKLTPEQAKQLGSKVRPITTADSYHVSQFEDSAESLPMSPHAPEASWPPKFKAKLTPEGELRTTGVCDDMTAVIMDLTIDNLPLQAKLLRLHVARYSEPHWKHLLVEFDERAGIFEFDGGLPRQEAEYRAAEILRCIAFLPELTGQ